MELVVSVCWTENASVMSTVWWQNLIYSRRVRFTLYLVSSLCMQCLVRLRARNGGKPHVFHYENWAGQRDSIILDTFGPTSFGHNRHIQSCLKFIKSLECSRFCKIYFASRRTYPLRLASIIIISWYLFFVFFELVAFNSGCIFTKELLAIFWRFSGLSNVCFIILFSLDIYTEDGCRFIYFEYLMNLFAFLFSS